MDKVAAEGTGIELAIYRQPPPSAASNGERKRRV